MGPFDDLILYDIDPDSMTDLEKEILYGRLKNRKSDIIKYIKTKYI